MTAAVVDVDGTLVDTNYQHALAWYRAFRACGVTLPVWQIHRHIGMGGDQLVPSLTDEQFERRQGERVRAVEKEAYMAMIEEVAPMEGAVELIDELHRRGHQVLLASSAKPDEIEHYLDLLDARERADGWTSAGDVEATKPEPDLVHAALQRSGGDTSDAVMIGDSPWDVHAARRAGVPTVAVMTGGFAREELLDAGAVAVFESVADLSRGLDETPLR